MDHGLGQVDTLPGPAIRTHSLLDMRQGRTIGFAFLDPRPLCVWHTLALGFFKFHSRELYFTDP